MKVKLRDLKLSKIIDNEHFCLLHELDMDRIYDVEPSNLPRLIRVYFANEKELMPKEWFEEVKELLTDEEKEYLKMCIKFSNIENIKYIEYIKNSFHCHIVLRENDNNSEGIIVNDKCFKNLKPCKEYTLKELGIEETI